MSIQENRVAGGDKGLLWQSESVQCEDVISTAGTLS